MPPSDDVLSRLTRALARRYTIVREIGAGGMATVYLADDVKHHRHVAVKVLRPDLAALLGAARFNREIEIAAQLTHPHILPLHDSGESDGLLYFVMPFVEGESLRGRIEREGALPVSDVVRLLRDIVDALAHAHGHGVVHRDIKPDNVMLQGRHALVTDFGVAKAVSEAGKGSSLTTVGVSLGTPSYMAPEQATADPGLDHRADLYAVGVVAYEMLAGKLPFSGPTAQAVLAAHLTERPRAISEMRTGTPAPLGKLVMKLLEKDPDKRYQTAGELLTELEQLATPSGGVTPIGTMPVIPALATPRRRAVAMVVTFAVLALAVGWIWRGVARRQWVAAEAMPAIRMMLDSGEITAAWRLARQAREITPGDSLLEAQWRVASVSLSLNTEPAGARVSRRAMNEQDSAWDVIGVTPLDSVQIARGRGWLRIEREGYRPIVALTGNGMEDWRLDDGTGPNTGMVMVPARRLNELNFPGYEQLGGFTIDSFWIDLHEITNRQFKEFVDSGGYQRRDLWTHEFHDGPRRLSFDEAMARFTDRTGRRGPATWEAGNYPAGQDDHPVSGVSWYEAAAYAFWAGKSLPTAYHWSAAAGLAAANSIVKRSNFGGRGTVPVGTMDGIGLFGTRDMAGNVREWTSNLNGTSAGAGRFILGGGFNDAPYAFNDAYAQSPFNRAEINGIRLVRYKAGDSTLARANQALVVATRDFARMRPVGDEVFRVYAGLFNYDRTPLDVRIERVDTAEQWIAQRISFVAAYGQERMTAWLYLPRTGRPPYQTIVFFPGSNVLFSRAFNPVAALAPLDFLVSNGRAVLYPIYKSTYERGDGFQSDIPAETAAYRDHFVMWIKDFRRSLDFLETRTDIDTSRIGYYGVSWGGAIGGQIPAVEPRIKVAALNVAGMLQQRGHPEVEQINYLPRVRIPVLMLNGRYDFYFPVETSQRPFFQLLGTPAQHKRQLIYESSHFVPRTALITELLSWYDRYLGPVGNYN